ncbi:hypothetical protein L3V83_01585 [Thiotrichales bacterium 19X7-9]|nr:hypothetical protein [Thiotrichales bacterium 19X7-9]
MKSFNLESYLGYCILLALSLLFMVLKLCGAIHWSWLWVFSPLWLPFTVILGGIALHLCFSFFISKFTE